MKNNDKIEILAPAGSLDSVIAAVRCGADAVYLGAKQFSARASAHNFDNDELAQAVRYCHVRNVKVHLTINTIIFDSELSDVLQLVKTAANLGVDAIIVQNIGVAMMIKQVAPNVALHGSTQMSVHSLSGAMALWNMGFSRVVLAREMTKEEIKEISENCPIETEVFVHGALCMCMSGQCYFSAMLGSRSGSRGACAQPCRLPFSVGGQKDGHALSLKDNSIIGYLNELEQIGVTSAKIEGRMKRPEYVAAAVTACKESRDLGFVTPQTAELLSSVFSRQGFTSGYYLNKRGQAMFGTRQKDDVVSASEKVFAHIRTLYKDEKPLVNIAFNFNAQIGKKPSLTVTDGINTISVKDSSKCEQAINVPLSQEKCSQQLNKTGGTPYKVTEINCTLHEKVSVPMSVINKLRRESLEKLTELREKEKNIRINDFDLSAINLCDRTRKITEHRAKFIDTKIGNAQKDFNLVFVPLFTDENKLNELVKNSQSIGVEIPRAMFSRDKKIEQQLQKVKTIGVNHVLCSNIGAFFLAKKHNMIIHGDFGFNFSNTLDLLWAEQAGFQDVILSFEMKTEQISRLGGKIKRGIISYGYLPLMICRNCPNKSENISCDSCKNQSKMQDRKDKKFFLKCDGFCTEVLNCVPLVLTDKLSSLCGIDFDIQRFSVENYVESVEKSKEYYNKLLYSKEFTRGLYYRGVK